MKNFLVLVCCLGLATVANAGVVAIYEFEGGLTDTSGSATIYDGTAIGSPELIVDGERGNVLSVSPGNQVDGGVVTPSSVTDLTVGLWVMTTQSVGASQCPLTSSSDCYQTVGGWQLMMREGPWPGPNNFWAGINGAPEVDPAWDGGYLFIHKDPDPVFTYGEWVHVVFTFDATSRMMKGYVNGLFCGEKLVTEDTRAVGGVDHLILGGQFEAFTGVLDDVFIADHVMTPDQVQSVFEVGVLPAGPKDPDPKDDETVMMANPSILSWTNMPPADSNDVWVDVWFGTEPNTLNPSYDMTLIVDATNADDGKNTETAMVDASVADTYYWQVNSYLNGADKIDDENMVEGPLWSFNAVDDVAPTVEIVTLDQMTWSGEGVPLDATVTDDAKSALTIEWTADDDSLADANLTIDISNADQADPTVTITKTVDTDDVVTVTMTVTVSDLVNPTTPDTASIEIDVYDDACHMAQVGQGKSAITDLSGNCITNLEDLAVVAAAWFDDYAVTGQLDRP